MKTALVDFLGSTLSGFPCMLVYSLIDFFGKNCGQNLNATLSHGVMYQEKHLFGVSMYSIIDVFFLGDSLWPGLPGTRILTDN